jgi:Leucyl aminopeptidase (aminopeptidase T)
MNDNLRKYALLLLKRCLCLDSKKRPLLITAPIRTIDFIEILAHEAYEMGITDIYFDWTDEFLKHEQLINLEKEDLIKSTFWNKKIYDEYAKKDAAFLMLYSDDIDLMSDVDNEKITIATRHSRSSRPLFKEKQSTDSVPWCIALAPIEGYANKVFAHAENPLEAAWDSVFKACLIYEDDPIAAWDSKVKKTEDRCNKLNDIKFKYLHYKNSLGTDLKVELPINHIWSGAGKENPEGLPLIVNMPTEEVFTSPFREGINGIVYSSLPLVYGGVLIENFSFKIENGKIIEIEAEKGKEVLEEMIATDENSCYFGEVALVDHDSPISNMKQVFYETLYDENASCHLAVGDSFPKAMANGENMTREELMELGLNHSMIHTDFMVGTPDMKIIGTTTDGKEIVVFENGNFVM